MVALANHGLYVVHLKISLYRAVLTLTGALGFGQNNLPRLTEDVVELELRMALLRTPRRSFPLQLHVTPVTATRQAIPGGPRALKSRHG